jgi:transcriptional regulator with XRE-family HTH domain
MTPEELVALFARRVRQLREAGGHTQEGFAAAANLDRAYYGRVERGQVNVSLSTVAAIAGALGVHPHTLFTFWHLPAE